MTSILRMLLRCEKGGTAVEYGLIIALIVLAIMGSLGQVATKTNGMWSNVTNEVTKY